LGWWKRLLEKRIEKLPLPIRRCPEKSCDGGYFLIAALKAQEKALPKTPRPKRKAT
jgi:hypothetical protein